MSFDISFPVDDGGKWSALEVAMAAALINDRDIVDANDWLDVVLVDLKGKGELTVDMLYMWNTLHKVATSILDSIENVTYLRFRSKATISIEDSFLGNDGRHNGLRLNLLWSDNSGNICASLSSEGFRHKTNDFLFAPTPAAEVTDLMPFGYSRTYRDAGPTDEVPEFLTLETIAKEIESDAIFNFGRFEDIRGESGLRGISNIRTLDKGNGYSFAVKTTLILSPTYYI